MFAEQHPLYNSLKKIKNVFIAEDDQLLRELFHQFVAIIPNLKVIGSSGDGKDVIKKCLEIKPDLIILDINMPEINGLEIISYLKSKQLKSKILVASGNINLENITLATSANVNGIVSKSDGLDELKIGIDAVLNGRYYYSSSVLELMPELLDKLR